MLTKNLSSIAGLVLFMASSPLCAQTADDVTKLIDRLVELDSIDLAKDVKYRAGLAPPLLALDADESGMRMLKNPYEVFGQNQPGAAGWYRVSFVVPEKLGKFAIPKGGYNLGIESNVQGAWEFYAYINGKPAGLWSKDGMLRAADQHPSVWMSNAPMPTRAGDRITVAILAMSSPLGRGSPDGYALRHLRLRFALGHTAARQPFFGRVDAPGAGTGLQGAREKLRTLQGVELKVLQNKLQSPLERMQAVFDAAETEKLDNLTKAMFVSGKEINEALKVDKLDVLARATEGQFIRAIALGNIVDTMQVVDVPYLWDGVEIVKDRVALQKKFQEAFARTRLGEQVEFGTTNTWTFGNLPKGVLNEKEQKLLSEILENTDRLVGVYKKPPSREGVVAVRIREGKAKVVGYRD